VGASRDDISGGQQARMNWDQIASCAGVGVSIGVHGLLHRNLVNAADAEVLDEVVASRDLIARCLRIAAPRAFCYPYGSCNARIRRAVRDAGYSYAVSTSSPRSQTVLSDPYDLRRETIYGNTPLWAFAGKISRRWDTARSIYWLPARAAVRLSRHLAESAGLRGRTQELTSGTARDERP
jgi:peptidoglycan/xylan/chitin deacetylase (PgdA/CDA1 family)